tara:strand:+ start:848 stop:1306 length:459 start_codon:yes stop_codon:yes gene_type:complete
MKKMKNLFLIITTLIILQSCGFKPIYSSQDLDINFINIEYEKNELNEKIIKTLKEFSNQKSSKFYDVKLKTKKDKKILTKDSKGNPQSYEKKITLDLRIFDEKKNFIRTFTSKLNYKDKPNKFQLKQYENEIQKQLLNDIIKDILIFLTEIE